MQCRALPFRELPHQPPLHLAFHDNFEKVSGFCTHSPKLETAAGLASALHYPQSRRSAVAAVLREQNEGWAADRKALDNITRLAAGAVAVVSGQQVGLFGGPAYSFYKALSAIQAAESLTDDGIDAVPVFWMATEDHDVDEVRRVAWFNEGELLQFELPQPEQDAIPVGRVRLGPEVDELVGRAQPLVGETFGAYLHETYVPEATYGGAFAGLFARIFADFGLILLDPLDDRLHQIAGPILRE